MALTKCALATSRSSDRIRRQSGDPVFEKGRLRTTSTVTLEHEGEKLQLRYHRSRWRLPDPDFPSVRQCTTKAKLYAGDTHAGSFEFTELCPEPLIDNHSFFEWADAMSSTLMELAEVLCSHWEELSEVSDYGTILELTRAWMDPAFSNSGRFARAANALIGMNKDWSLLVLKAFPLEYEGSGSDSDQFVQAQNRRQRAMMRHYHSALGVAPFPEAAGNHGWMYLRRAGLPIADPINGAGDTISDW
ncbi:hypothetical protein GRI44_13110 [Altererythrobacter confluentis]|uniref:Uncharacterized protein n=1 Tax=Allopontixanthobacter confluentis TaxID=1849021 RepID=A0A6L7GLD3_9SPHN|nr:hypothetical protein [Allopontixanthobacter confluentis]MXP15688.1 hypothetical protein [Allopontixanthobacter confluentis]